MKKVIYIISAILLAGCVSKDLDRSNAASIIEEFYNYPVAEVIQVASITIGNPAESLSAINNQTTVQFITEEGKIVQLGNDSESGFGVIGNELRFNEVTGIRTVESGKKAIVDFTEKRTKITPIGKQLNHKEADIIEKEVTMELYDDGWRITTAVEESIESTDIPIAKSANEAPEKSTETIAEENSEGDETLAESSASFFLLKKAFTEEGEHYVAVDYVGEDGSNINPKLRIFKITNDFNASDYCGRYKKSGRIKNFSDLQTIKNDSLKLYIVVEDNIVKCIEFTDLPEPKPVKIEDLPRRPKSDVEKRSRKDSIKAEKVDKVQQKLKDTVG